MKYVFGHSDRELQRLADQAVVIEPITRQLLVDAGISAGMRVLDVGTGRGDVAFLAAELVGDDGLVVGVDRAPEAIGLARERAEARLVRNVAFEEGDAADLAFEAPFDALIGRYFLEFQSEPAQTLSRLLTCVRPGAIVAFQEIDWTGFRSVPPVEIWDRCCELMLETIGATGADTRVGAKLPSIFAAAGVPPPSMESTATIGAGANSHVAAQRMAGLVRTVLPSLEERGLVSRGELDPDSLAARIVDEAAARASAVIGWSEVRAWSRFEG
jgi:SAM-dependent methyltransferase